jgi:hypothetical protein
VGGSVSTVALWDKELLTTTNGTLIDGTGAGPYHRRVVDVGAHSRAGWQWVLWDAAGSTSAINFYTTVSSNDERQLANTVPLPTAGGNPLWALDSNYLFGTYPAGAIGTAVPLQVTDYCVDCVLVEVVVAVDMPRFSMLFFGAEG